MARLRWPTRTTGESPLVRSARALQHTAEQAGPAAGASYTLIGAILLLGGIGYAVDAWRGTSPWFLLGGLLLGIVVGFYELAKIVWQQMRAVAWMAAASVASAALAVAVVGRHIGAEVLLGMLAPLAAAGVLVGADRADVSGATRSS